MPRWFPGFSEFPDITEFNESSAPFRVNPNGPKLQNLEVYREFYHKSWIE